MTLVAGFVAAAGDRMGQLAAKRKIRIGKMRPRDASRLVAVMTGMAISLVTFAVVLLIFKDFREALTRYSETKRNLATVQAERDGMRDEIRDAEAGRDEALKAMQDAVDSQKEAEELTLNAQNKLLALEDQLSVADAQITAKEKELSDKQAEVARIQKELDSARQELKNIAIQKEGDQLQLRSLQDLKERAKKDIAELNLQIEELKGSQVEIELGQVLAYWQVSAGEPGVADLLGEKLRGIQVDLARDGHGVDDGSVEELRSFAADFRPGTGGAVVIVRSARNVFAADNVLLNFSGIQLVPILRQGSDLLTIAVSDSGSSVHVLGGATVALTLGNSVDLDFTQRLDRLYRDTVVGAGFLPRIAGSIDSSVLNELMFMADEINAHSRPYVIHIRAPRDMTAIDGPKGLSELEIIISEGTL